ncbi:MAG: hypothetical protein JRE28_07475 [Deltaproteobacteria bacterium]|nr:hypothetical protein [Deltaproteobacteria bacterium]
MLAYRQIVYIVIDFFVNYSFQVVGAILVLVIGVLVARSVSSFLLKFFEKKKGSWKKWWRSVINVDNLCLY